MVAASSRRGYHGLKLAQRDGVLTSQLEATLLFKLVDHPAGAGDQDDEPVRILCSFGSLGLEGVVAPVEQRFGPVDETTKLPWVDLHFPAIVATASGSTLRVGVVITE